MQHGRRAGAGCIAGGTRPSRGCTPLRASAAHPAQGQRLDAVTAAAAPRIFSGGRVAVLLGRAADPLMDTDRDQVFLSPATSVQIFPPPRPGWAAISLPAEPEPILTILLLAEKPEQASPRQPPGQRGGLLLRARLPQPGQQPGHAVQVVEGDVGGGASGQRGGLLLRARLPQPVQQPGHAARVVEGHVGGGALGQRGGLPRRAGLPQAVQQADDA